MAMKSESSNMKGSTTSDGISKITKQPIISDSELQPAFKNSQAQSILFSLPSEVRNMVYEFALGGYAFRIETSATSSFRMGHAEAATRRTCLQNFAIPQSEMLLGVIPYGSFSDMPKQPLRAHRLALLLSCSRIYLEAGHFLYSGNTFEFPQADGFQRLLEALAARSLSSLKNVNFSFAISGRKHYFGGEMNQMYQGLIKGGFFRHIKNLKFTCALGFSAAQIKCFLESNKDCLGSLSSVELWFKGSIFADVRPERVLYGYHLLGKRYIIERGGKKGWKLVKCKLTDTEEQRLLKLRALL